MTSFKIKKNPRTVFSTDDFDSGFKGEWFLKTSV